MPKRTAAHIIAGFDGDLMEIEGTRAQQSTSYIERIQQCLIRNEASSEVETLLRASDLCLVAVPRCSAKSGKACVPGKGWRCKRPARNGFGSYCVECRQANQERGAKLFANRMVRDSVRNDNIKLMDRQFVKCENCGIPMLKQRHKWCYQCRRLKRAPTVPHNNLNTIPEHYDFRANPRYLTEADVTRMRKEQKDQCYFCNKVMMTSKRNKNDGMTIERLGDGPHWASECVLSCGGCNRRSWRPGYCPFPWALAKMLDLTPVNGFLKSTTTVNDYTRWKTENGDRWCLEGTSQSTIASHLPSRLCVRNQARLLAELRQTQPLA